MMQLPRLYAILDAGCFSDANAMFSAAEELAAGGCTLLQYRNKAGNARVMLEQARELERRLSRSHLSQNRGEVRHSTLEKTESQNSHPFDSLRSLRAGSVAKSATRVGHPASVKLIMNDRTDLCLAADFDGVHVGQEDLSPESVRKIIGPDRWLGVSTHNPEQLREADLTSADYLAIGPVFATSSKEKPDPVIGLEGVRRARQLTRKPLVAIGGITRANAASVIEAGADSVAVISDLLREPRKSAEEFFRILR
jgi:thiamine-phosphate pyrophosphorylase